MKNVNLTIRLFVFTYLFVGFVVAQSTTKRVLFLGNSYTYGNSLPNMVAQLASSAGDSLIFDSHTPGGHRLMQHAVNATSLQKIAAGTWDYVIIQAQSQEPSWSVTQVESEVLPYAKILSDSARAANECTNPMFFMTWGRENGDQQNCPFAPWVCTYEGMDSALAVNYTRMAFENKGIVSPVGKVWRNVRENLGQQLYTGDGSHPNLTGSYVAACSFYASIFQKDPTQCTWDGGINTGVAMLIRDAAKAIVFDSLSNYSYVENHSNASYSTVINYDTVTFNPNGSVYDSLLWSLGDGTYSTVDSLTHVYGDSATYIVELVTYKCGLTDTAVLQIQTSLAPPVDPGNPGDTVGLNSISPHAEYRLFPNPALDELHVDAGFEISSISIYDLKGRLVYEVENIGQSAVVPLFNFEPGVYTILLTDGNYNRIRRNFIKH